MALVRLLGAELIDLLTNWIRNLKEVNFFNDPEPPGLDDLLHSNAVNQERKY